MPAHSVTHDAEDHGGIVLSSTQFTNAVDMGALCLYHHTRHNRRVRMIDLNMIDFDASGGEPMMMRMDEGRAEDVQAVSFGGQDRIKAGCPSAGLS